MDTSTVGLDIGTSQIKVLQFNPSKKELTFLYNGALPFEVMQNKISPQKNEEEGFLAELIKTLFKESPLDKNRVVILVQGDDIVYEYLELHKMNPRELSVALPIESRKFVSHVLEEMHFTFAYAPILPPKQKAYTTGILLTAVPKKLISERMQLLHECGINPLAIEVPAIPLCRVHTYTPKPQKEEKTIALLDIGAKYTNISVVREGVVYFSKDLLIGGNNFTHALELGGPYSFAEAEARKRELRFLEKEETPLTSVLHSWAEQIKQITSFENHRLKGRLCVDEIILSGGSAYLNCLDEYLSTHCGINVRVDDTIANTLEKKDSLYKIHAQEQLFFKMALGLALREERK